MSLVLTRLQNFRPQSNMDKNERRASQYGAFELFKNQTESPNGIISDALKSDASKAIGSTLQVPVVDFSGQTVSVGAALTLTIPNVENTSTFVNVTFVSYSFGFHIHPAKHFNNEISMQKDFDTKLETFELDLMSKLDSAAITAMENAKTQVLTDDLGGRYALTANTIVAPLAEENYFIGDINPLMNGNDFYQDISIVANPSLQSHIRTKLGEKGTYNSETKTYQYMDKSWYFSNRVANDVAHKATGFAVSGSNTGILQQYEVDALMGSETHKHKWDIAQLPMSGINIGTYFYDDAIDGSGLAGAATAHLTRTKVQAFGFAGYFAFLTAYNSDPVTLPSPIAKVAISKT